MVQLLIDRGADVNGKGRVCHLIPVILCIQNFAASLAVCVFVKVPFLKPMKEDTSLWSNC